MVHLRDGKVGVMPKEQINRQKCYKVTVGALPGRSRRWSGLLAGVDTAIGAGRDQQDDPYPATGS
jgi:hypothetical protein